MIVSTITAVVLGLPWNSSPSSLSSASDLGAIDQLWQGLNFHSENHFETPECKEGWKCQRKAFTYTARGWTANHWIVWWNLDSLFPQLSSSGLHLLPARFPLRVQVLACTGKWGAKWGLATAGRDESHPAGAKGQGDSLSASRMLGPSVSNRLLSVERKGCYRKWTVTS